MKQEIKVHAFLANLPLFKEASAEEIDRIARGTRSLHAARGETLFHKGDMPEGFHLVVYGQVKLAFTSPQGADKVVEIIGPGMSFGEAVMFLETPHVVYAQTLADSLLLHVSKTVVFNELEHSAAFARKMLGGLSRRLHGIISDVEAYCMHSGAQRVIGYLLRDAEQAEGNQEVEVMLPTNKGVIASRLNLTPQHFSRILHELAEAGLVAVDGRTIHIADIQRLRAAC
jgi:CRP-like cAMP-binding protein